MLRLVLLVFFIFSSSLVVAQESSYSQLIAEGWNLCREKQYKEAAVIYEAAFEKVEEKVSVRDRYNLACIYALGKNRSQAFFHLFVLSNEHNWDNIEHLKGDTDLKSLHQDTRWETLIALLEYNRKKIERKYDTALVKVLNEIHVQDQEHREKIRATENKYGRQSKEVEALWKRILHKDLINLLKVEKILSEHGWPTKEQIGERGARTLFLVIQHASQEAQEKHLPTIKKALKTGDLPKSQFAMFYDRLLLRRGELQIYGTQLAIDEQGEKPYVLPLKDPQNVDERRAEAGLNSMQENLNRWNLKWDADAYIKALPQIIKRMEKHNE